MSHESIKIYVVDDDHGHCELIKRNLRRGGIVNELAIYHEAETALHAIHKSKDDEPILVLLDINMPGTYNGIDLLSNLKKDPETKNIPIVMLTTTENPKEIKTCYDLGCNAYITKPVDVATFNEVIHKVGLFLGVVKVASNK